MAKLARLLNWLIRGCSLAAGGAAFYVFGKELITSGTELASSGFGYYVVLVTDLIVSFIGSAMLAYLLYFCVWHCFIGVLINAGAKRKY